MRLFLTLSRTYPLETFIMMVAILFAGIAEGIGISALLPMLNIAMRSEQESDIAPDSAFEAMVSNGLHRIGIEPTIGALLIIIFVGILIKSLLLLFARKRIGYTVAQVTTELRIALLRAILATRWEYFLHQPIGQLANSMASEAIRASNAYVNSTVAITAIVQAAVYIVIALLVSWQATLICLVAGLGVLAISHFLVKMARSAGKRQTRLLRSLLARLTDTLQSVKPLKAMARETLADAVLTAETSRLNRALQKEVFSSAALGAVQEPMFVGVIVGGLYLALVGWEMSLATAMVLVILAMRILKQLGTVQKQYQKTVTHESAFWALRKAIEQAESAKELATGSIEPHLDEAIRLDHVHFSYDETPVLKNVSLELRTRSLTTLVGGSGGGKTTILDLIIGLHKPTAGRVLLDDIPLEQVNLGLWRQQIGYVPQEQVLLHDSVFINVTLGDPGLGEADVEHALRAAGAWEFVQEMPEGPHSSVGERGTRLSGGQRQRIMIARALVHRPKVLILDEATSALDPESEAVISRTLGELRKDYTIIAVSHQPALVEVADRVYRVENGIVTLAKNGDLATVGMGDRA